MDEKIAAVKLNIIEEKRTRLNEIIKEINNFVINRRLAITDVDLPDSMESVIMVFSHSALKDANDLANELSRFSRYVEMRSLIPYKEFLISFNFEHLVKVINIDRFRGKDIIELISTKKEITNSQTINTISYEIELALRYWKLYSLEYSGEWDVYEQQEKEIFKTVIGAKERPESNMKIFRIMAEMDCIFIGNYAASCITPIVKRSGKIQVISNRAIRLCENIVGSLAKIGMRVKYKERQITLPFDFRLRMFSVTLNNTILVEVFNSAEYELIMYKNFNVNGINIRVANPYVICKFMLLEIYLFRLLFCCDCINIQTFELKRKEMIHIVRTIRNIKFDIVNIYGTHIDEDRIIKITCTESGKFFFPYYPAKFKEENGVFKTIDIK